ncbi:transposase [Soehngenia saccharolytica]|nr:transposase [Soehngenia saccharolytica]
MNRGYKYRIYPNKEQEMLIQKTFGCARFIYNKMLENRITTYEKYKENKTELKKQKYRTPASYKGEFPWLKEVDSLALANVQMDLDKAYKNFFRDSKVGYPKYKSKHKDRKSYTTNNQKGSIRIIDENHIRIPILKDLKIKMHRPLKENSSIKAATISQTPTGKYFISILLEYPEDKTNPIKPMQERVLGLDYSSTSLYIDDKGVESEYPKYYRQAEMKLKKEQRKLSKKKEDSKNREKQRQKVAKLHEKVANQRKDFLHKKSRQIANVYDAVIIEDINMKAIAQCLNLGKSTNDNGFGKLKIYLDYKLKEEGKQLIKIDKWYPSSKQCSHCNTINKELTLSQRSWKCSTCGEELDRDINAAINIKNEGCRILGIA